MSDWIDSYVDNEGLDSKNKAVSFIKPGEADCDYYGITMVVKEVIRTCSRAEPTYLNYENFKKLKIIVVNECAFDIIRRLQIKNNSQYDYIIFISKDVMGEGEQKAKHKIAHEIAHYLFVLQEQKYDKGEEEINCNAKAREWGFPDPT